MKSYQQRVREEKTELDKKIASLSKFFESEKFKELGPKEKDLLEQQYPVMEQYSYILKERIRVMNIG